MKKYKLFSLLLVLFFAGCASISQLIQKPGVKFQGARLSDFSFSDITLNVDLAVSNPNPIGISLAGYDYSFSINEKQFLNGEQQQDVQVRASGTSTLTIPIGIKFEELYQLFSSMKTSDEVPYQVNGHVTVNLPLGPVRIPYSAKGKLPAVKLPKISLQKVKVEAISLSGIKLNLGLNVENPNIFGFSLSNFNYDINLSGKKVVSGKAEQENKVPGKGQGTISIPVQLDFAGIGTMITQALSKGDINYQLTGGGDFKTEFGDVKLPIDSKGLTKIWR